MTEPEADGLGAALVRIRAPQHDLVARRLRAQLRHDLLARESPVDRIGRFTVLEPIGSGAMGTVLAAHDPELDRRVALKLIPATDPERRASAIREARALARLAHPNVVTVHDVGEFPGGLYVAMELVAGTTLLAELERGRQPWPTLATWFVQAGRGLAAAHAAGIVHRDFKPSNVLIGDGRVRVVDFGLARIVDDDVGSDGRAGTPAYMAPELLAVDRSRESASAKADQFAFAVTVFEAVHGRRPFTGTSPAALLRSIEAGPVWTDRRTPASVRRAVLRALSIDPAARFAAMEELVARLVPARRGPTVALAVAAAGCGAVVTWGATRTTAAPCADVDRALASAWNDERREQLGRAAATAGAEASWPPARAALDDWTSRWIAMRRDVCEAAVERHELSAALVDARTACLDRGRAELVALVDTLADDEPKRWLQARAAVAGLFPLERCAQTDVLAALGPVPDDPAILELHDELARCEALLRVGDYNGARDLATPLRARADAIGWRPLVAETALVSAEVARRLGDFDEAEARFREALWIAEAVRHEQVAADAATSLVEVVGTLQLRPARALEWAEHAHAANERLGIANGTTIQLAHALANVYRVAGRHAEAVQSAELELALATERNDPYWEVGALVNLAGAESAAGRTRASIEHAERGLERARPTWGASHPNVATIHNNLGNAYADVRELEPSMAHLRSAIAIWSASLGPNDGRVATARMNLATVLKASGRTTEALAELDAALPVLRAAVGAQHPDVAGLLGNRAGVLDDLGRTEDARAQYLEALAVYRSADGETRPEIALVLLGLGRIEGKRGRPDAAVVLLQDALARAEAGALLESVLQEIRDELALARAAASSR